MSPVASRVHTYMQMCFSVDATTSPVFDLDLLVPLVANLQTLSSLHYLVRLKLMAPKILIQLDDCCGLVFVSDHTPVYIPSLAPVAGIRDMWFPLTHDPSLSDGL